MSDIFIKTYGDIPYDYREIFRYAGVIEPGKEIKDLLQECITEADGTYKNDVCYGIFDYDGQSASKSLAKNLTGCSRVIIFAATIGIQLDRLIVKYSKISPSKALMFQAIGSERIESLCDIFCNDVKNELSVRLKPRFSAGYGDLPLEVQKDIFRVLDCPKRIGLTLNDSLLMSPTKSVTAIVGIENEV